MIIILLRGNSKDRHKGKTDHVKTQKEDSHLQAKERCIWQFCLNVIFLEGILVYVNSEMIEPLEILHSYYK